MSMVKVGRSALLLSEIDKFIEPSSVLDLKVGAHPPKPNNMTTTEKYKNVLVPPHLVSPLVTLSGPQTKQNQSRIKSAVFLTI